ncbi:MAG TPA: FHA domain-containing protein, partial [Kofleriaceae bacterium]|nr:FHA domain-containing protein [Kofleriaceae bacterium]
MAILKHLQTGAEVALAARHVVGRSRTCQLPIDLASVSALHAELTWDGQAWSLRDLGSRNGTFVAGQRIPAGQQVKLEPGAEVGFGAPERLYRFVDGSAPRLIAFGPDEVLVAEDDVLCIPSPGACEAMIFRDVDGRWVVESPEATRAIGEVEWVVVGGRPFHVHVPSGVLATREAEALREAALDDGIFELAVSRDGEHVDLRLRHGDRVQPIESRAHAFLLLALARAR